jgi:hypothetical protein
MRRESPIVRLPLLLHIVDSLLGGHNIELAKLCERQ